MKVISFFSFKGGVGRTALLSNLGAYWASQGKVVLLMDLDLVAPGISYSLPGRLLDDRGTNRGMSDLLHTFFESVKEDPQKINLLHPELLIRQVESDLPQTRGALGNLFFIPAGSRQYTIERSVPGGDAGEDIVPPIPGTLAESNEEPEQTASRALAYYLKERLKSWTVPQGPAKGKDIDYLLIDTRTGFAELLDLSLGYLADKMVLISSLNEQNLKGLEFTLDALKDKRVPVDTFPLFVTIAFSPLPAAEDAQLYQRMEKAQQIIAQSLRFNSAGQKEIAPKSFSIHYNQFLATRESLLVLEQPKSLYAREVIAIAHHLEGKSTKDDLQDELIRETRRKALRTIPQEKPVPPAGIPAVKETIRDNPFIDLPSWYWPLTQADQEMKKRHEILIEWLPENPNIELNRESFANRLCWSTSLSIEKKLEIMKSLPGLSQSLVDQLIEVFDDERSEFMEQWSDIPTARDSLLQDIFRLQRQWAIAILKDEKAGNIRFLTAPDEHIFQGWEKQWRYWLLLARDILVYLDDRERALAMIDRAAAIAADKNAMALHLMEIIDPQTISPSLLRFVESLALKLASSEPWLNYFLARNRLQTAHPDKEAAKELLLPLLGSPPPDAGRCIELANLVLDKLPEIAPRAEAIYRRAIALDETDASPWHNLGNLLTDHLKRYDEAEAAYRQAIALDETDAPPWYGLGNLLQDYLNRCDEAEIAYRRAIAIDDKFAPPWYGLGNLLTDHLKRYDEAEAAYRRAIALDEKLAPPWHGLGNLLQDHLKRYGEAEAAYRQAIALYERNAHPWYGLGKLLHYHLNRCDEAEAAYRRAIALDEQDASPWNGLGLLQLYAYKDCKKAVETFKKGLEISTDITTAYLNINLGHLFLQSGQEQTGREYLEEAFTGFAGQDDYDANTLYLAAALNDTKKVKKYLLKTENEYRKGDKDSAFSLLCYAVVYRPEDIENYKKQTWGAIQDYDDHFVMLLELYYLAGLRPEIAKQASALVAELLTFPQELTWKFKDEAKPDEWYDRFRPFAGGKSRGAGDPADLHLFCKGKK